MLERLCNIQVNLTYYPDRHVENLFSNLHVSGPGLVYMSRAPGDNVKAYDGSGDWFKIFQEGVCNSGGDFTTNAWCTWDRNWIAARIPANTPNGEYLVRVEHIGERHNRSLYRKGLNSCKLTCLSKVFTVLTSNNPSTMSPACRSRSLAVVTAFPALLSSSQAPIRIPTRMPTATAFITDTDLSPSQVQPFGAALAAQIPSLPLLRALVLIPLLHHHREQVPLFMVNAVASDGQAQRLALKVVALPAMIITANAFHKELKN